MEKNENRPNQIVFTEKMKERALTVFFMWYKKGFTLKGYTKLVQKSLDTIHDQKIGNATPAMNRMANRFMFNKPWMGNFYTVEIWRNAPGQTEPLRKYNEYGFAISTAKPHNEPQYYEKFIEQEPIPEDLNINDNERKIYVVNVPLNQINLPPIKDAI